MPQVHVLGGVGAYADTHGPAHGHMGGGVVLYLWNLENYSRNYTRLGTWVCGCPYTVLVIENLL